MALEPEFWIALERIATSDRISLSGLVARIDAERAGRNLASALRVYVLARALGGAPIPP